MAVKKGMFARRGLEPQFIAMQSRIAVGALSTNQVDYIATLGDAHECHLRGLAAQVVMVFSGKSHFVLISKAEIKAPKDLKGRNVAINQVGGTTYLSFIKILEKYGMNKNDVKVMVSGRTRNSVIMLQQKRVDAAMVTGLAGLILEDQGFRPLVFLKDISDIPLAGFVAMEENIRDKRDEMKRVIMASLEGIVYTRANPEAVIPAAPEIRRPPESGFGQKGLSKHERYMAGEWYVIRRGTARSGYDFRNFADSLY